MCVCVCMYVCVYVCYCMYMCVCMYVYMCMRMYICIYACVYMYLPYYNLCCPFITGCHLFCTSCLDGNFLRVALAVKNKVYMWFWKHPALPASLQGPPSPTDNHLKSFVKSKVRISQYVGTKILCTCGCLLNMVMP